MTDFDRINPGARQGWKPNFEIRFPPLPRTVAEVSKLLAESTETPDTPGLVEIVNSDPVVGASVLRRINSAYYGMRTRVADIQKACFLLGFEEVCDIVLTAGMMKLADIFTTKSQIEIFEDVISVSLGAALYSKKLAQFLDLAQKNFAFTSGLLHTSGRLVLLYNRPSDYEALWFTTEGGQAPSVTSEQLIFGTDHAELGARAAEHWHLPLEAVMVIRNYLTPGHVKTHEIRILALTLSVAAGATEQLCIGTTEDVHYSPPAALYSLARQLDVSAADLETHIVEQQEEVRRFMHSMIHA